MFNVVKICSIFAANYPQNVSGDNVEITVAPARRFPGVEV